MLGKRERSETLQTFIDRMNDIAQVVVLLDLDVDVDWPPSPYPPVQQMYLY